MDRILLIDLMNQIHRSCITFGPIKTHVICFDQSCIDPNNPERRHKQTKAHCFCGSNWDQSDDRCYGDKYSFIFNFFRNIRPLIENGAPDKIFAVLEGHPQFRYDLFPEYKANRIIKQGSKQETQDKFSFVRDEIIRLLQYLPLTIARAANYEADDLIATLVENMKDEDLTVITNDGDYAQLLQKGYLHLTIYNPIKKEVMVAPEYSVIAFKSLTGDKSDNIPRLVSDKKALKFLHNPDSFQEFMADNESRSNFNINRDLIEFRQVPEEEIILKEGIRNFPVLKGEFERMDFQSIINPESWHKYMETFNCVKY